jgi:protein involved in polysaccharide export with SLBB domain
MAPRIFALIRRLATGALFVAVQAASAQQLPSPAQARTLLETRPDLVAQLRQELVNSGLTPDQIRARLRASGYPEDLLDAYMGARRTGRDSAAVLPLTENVLDAMAALGVGDSTNTAELRDLLRRRRAAPADTLRRRRLGPVATDSLALLDSLGMADSTELRPVLDSLGRVSFVPRRRDTRTLPLARVDSGFTIFGLSLFSNATSQFDPNLAGAVDATYRLGPGDRLVLVITGDAERGYTLDVTREGMIVIPGVGQLAVANLTLSQLEQLLYPALGRVFSGLRRDASATTHFSVNIARLHTNQVVVLGDVVEPGSYRVSSAGTALTAIYAAGGPSRDGSLRRVEIRRGGTVADTLDLYDYLLRGDGSHDPRLQNGDVVFVPVHGPRVRAYGEVVRPATYELRKGETLADLLRQAGGFTAEAARRRVQIARILPPTQRDTTERARVLLDVSSDAFASGIGPAYPLEAGDVVRVFPVADRVSRRVTVRGAVWTPGAVGLTPGMRLSEALALAGGLSPDAYRGEVLVSRLRPAESTRIQLRTALSDGTGGAGNAVDDLVLSEDDEIRVFAMSEFRTPEYVAITGAVRHGGRFAFRDGMTLRDLVLIAGGLETHASLDGAELARVSDTPTGGRLAVTRKVALDSSYVMLRQANGAPRSAGGLRSDIALQPFDNVLIVPKPDWERPRLVVVTGEVRAPGTYVVAGKGDRLADLLQRAGGLTTSGYAGGVRFYRRQGRVGRVGIDLPRVLRDAAHQDNLLLQDGDSVHIPAYSGVVEVQGAVSAPRGVSYRPGATLKDYVRAAGGPTGKSELNRAYVTQADGSVESVTHHRLWFDGMPVPTPGSVVFVPDKGASERSNDGVAQLGVWAQIIGSIVTIVAITRR